MTDTQDIKRVFVLMPFSADFDDVYMVIRDACTDQDLGVVVTCERADDIEKPGRITDQIIDAIRTADAVVADITGANANVMYELGYADALHIPTLILNQSVKESPFDVASMRQVLYDRTRLVKDCRPRLVSGLSAIFGTPARVPAEDSMYDDKFVPAHSTPRPSQSPLLISDGLIMQIQTLHLQMEVARTVNDAEKIEQLGRDVLALADRIALTEHTERDDLQNLAAVLSNCGLQLELAELFQAAEDVWKRAIGLAPDHPGIHYQYADFLVDRGRRTDAIAELQRARELNPEDRRLQHLEMKLALAGGEADPTQGPRLEQLWRRDMTDKLAASAYLLFLSRVGEREEFERVCREWENALPPEDKHYAVRALADHFTEHDVTQARDLYVQLLGHGDASEQAAVLHNLATIHAGAGEDAEAELRWREAYELQPGSPLIRAAFSQLLSRRKKLEDAVKVAAGEPLDNSTQPASAES